MKNPDQNSFQRPVSLLDYLRRQGWKPSRDDGREEVPGLCPLHRETQPSFYVNRRKELFYCHGCKRGGGLAQLRKWLEGQALSQVRVSSDPARLLEDTYRFYQSQLSTSPEAQVYLRQRGIYDSRIIESMRIGYTPGACLRAHLFRLGYCRATILSSGLIDARSRDRFFRCLTFPLEEAGNLYGRSIDTGPWRHHFLPRSKGGLYGWQQAQAFCSLILVEGLFDLAALWQAGFPQTVAVLGSRVNPLQMAQLCAGSHGRVHVCFDADWNCTGQRAALQLRERLQRAGVEVLRVTLPSGCDPAGWFAAGGKAADFQRYLERARP